MLSLLTVNEVKWKLNTCRFTYYVKCSEPHPCISNPDTHPRASNRRRGCLVCIFFFSSWYCILSSVIVTVPHHVCAGVCAVFSVVPTHRVSTVSGRTTTLTVVLVQASSLVRCAKRTSWRRSCCCSVSTVIGGYCSLELHMHTQD